MLNYSIDKRVLLHECHESWKIFDLQKLYKPAVTPSIWKHLKSWESDEGSTLGAFCSLYCVKLGDLPVQHLTSGLHLSLH